MQRAPPRGSPCSAPLSQPLVACPLRHRNRARLQRAQQQARASETDVGTVGQGSLQALDTASASNNARTWRDKEPAGPEMPFGLLLALAAAGTAETAYLTLVRGPAYLWPALCTNVAIHRSRVPSDDYLIRTQSHVMRMKLVSTRRNHVFA